MAKIRTHYDNLKVAANAPDNVIRAAYKALCQKYHPDKSQGNKEEHERILKIISNSYQVLIDPAKRVAHDIWIKEQTEKLDRQQPKASEEYIPNEQRQRLNQEIIPVSPVSYTFKNPWNIILSIAAYIGFIAVLIYFVWDSTI